MRSVIILIDVNLKNKTENVVKNITSVILQWFVQVLRLLTIRPLLLREGDRDYNCRGSH